MPCSRDFLPRYNTRFAVPGRSDRSLPTARGTESGPWTKSSASSAPARWLGTTRSSTSGAPCNCCPARERPSYAGVQVEVLEHTDGRLQVRHEGEIIPCRPAPPRPGALRASHGALAPNSRNRPHRETPGQSSRQPAPAATPGQPGARSRRRGNRRSRTITVNLHPAGNSPRDSWPSGRRCSRPRAQGLSLREISRQLGVHRNTVRKYARSETQPTNLPVNRGARRSPEPAVNRSD